jgi:hypothetical protein
MDMGVRLVLCFSLPAYGGRKDCEDFPFLVTYTFLNPSEADFPQLPQLTDKLASTVQQKQPESRSTQLPMFYDSVAMTPRPLPLHHSYPRLLKKIPQQHITSPTPTTLFLALHLIHTNPYVPTTTTAFPTCTHPT